MAAEAAHHGVDLMPVVALLAAGVIAVPLFRRFGLDSVLGYLAAGVVIGPYGFGLFTDPDTIIFRVTNGRLVHDSPNYPAPRVLSFESHDVPVSLPTIRGFRARGEGIAEMTLPELVRVGTSATTPPPTRNATRANFHFRLVEVSMMLLLPLLAVALAVPPKRSTSGLGIFLSVVFVVTYHKVCQYAEQMGALGRIDPLIALWTPFLLFGGLILWMYWTLAYKPGGQPIGALERAFAKAGKALRRIIGLGARREAAPAA
jgi:lipopolysaccharide export system permease protein